MITIDRQYQAEKKISYNIFFDKEKIHDLFYKTGISYSDIIKEKFIYYQFLVKMINCMFITKIFFMKIGITHLKMMYRIYSSIRKY